MSLQPQPLKNWPHSFDQRYMYRRLGIEDRPDDHQVLHDLAQEVYDIVAVEAINEGRAISNIFRSSYSRTKNQFEWRKRIPRLPAAVRNHVTDLVILTGALYKYVNCIQDELQKEFETQLNEEAAAKAEETAAETRAETEAEMNAPAAQRRRLGVTHKTVTVPAAGLASGLSPGPTSPLVLFSSLALSVVLVLVLLSPLLPPGSNMRKEATILLCSIFYVL
ncbi:hypothetical protein N7537_008035 [Penicillium hordei]|uniref:Uncharacterized protein n=1 Tax=Penicillium hordei TaxID=40994 RepID=A0AAD6GZY6_9EURO|nr:uncharacterized protein N7537_008035 [Penicillium hordei]KAJ5597951.1 hypothetical protein N7537_008035 [Penicillium hordei]